ncbi:MAG: ATP-binding protein [Propionicimonas sp.]
MNYTPVHRLLGAPAGPLTSSLLDDAVTAQLPEARDLDWKRPLPKSPGSSDFPKDVAAMANSGGGMIVYGVTESNKVASGRQDLGQVSERE